MADRLIRLRDPWFLAWRLPWLVISLLLGAVATFGAIMQPLTSEPFRPIGDSFLGRLRYPIERNSHLRLPFISSPLFSVVLSVDGRTALAVAGDGTILKTTDRGDTWTVQPSGTSEQLWSVAISPDGGTALAVGNDGTVLKTTDRGDTWTVQPSGTSQPLHSVAISPDGGTALAVGWNGTILKTTDLGDTWTVQPSGTSQPLYSVAISPDGGTALAVGWNGTILKTTDLGDTWTVQPSGTSETLRSVATSPDGGTALAVGNDGTILKTTDRGDTWTVQPSGTSETFRSVAISPDGGTALAVGNDGTVLKTTDRGDTWTAQPSGTSEQLWSVAISPDGGTTLAVGLGGTILKTTDLGDTWTAPISGASGILHSVAISPDGGTALAVGNDGTVLKTTDRGDTWTAQPSGTSEQLWSVAISPDGGTALAVGNDGTVLKTTDRGDTWTAQPSGTSEQLWSVAISPDGGTTLAVGWNGTILKTTDRGDTWTVQPSGTSEQLWSVAISPDGGTALAVGNDGTVLKTTDRGDTWTVQPSGTSEQLWSVAISPDGGTALAVGNDGTVLKTTDRGDTWTVQPSGTSETLRSVAISPDGGTALAVGNDGTVLKTTDRGDTWTVQPSGTSETLRSVAISPDGGTALAVGSGAILLTADEGVTWRLLTAEDDYRKYPASWTWIFYGLAILLLLQAFQSLPPPATVTESISDHLVSDRPIEAGDPDPLQRRSIANTLSHFLRNENTEPPMTIAITGNWGEGKSSLMNLVQAGMKKHGAVWFNAWHHQKEQHLFAALLQAVRDQAIPSAWTPRGLRFRCCLVALRARHHWVWAIIALVLASFSVGMLRADPSSIITAVLQWQDLDKNKPPVIFLVLSVLIVIQGWIVTLKRSGVNPGWLMAAASGAFRIKTFGNQLGFRHRFGEAFEEVTKALKPRKLLILIDDLDRCRPEQVVETLEAINFLVSAGSCYVVMGIAPEQVMHCVGLGFKEVAAEMTKATGNGQNPEIQARDARRDYAHNYLEKLINIEVPIPKLTDEDARKLAEPVRPNEGPSEFRRALWNFVRRLVTILGVFAILGASIYVGERMYQNATMRFDQGQRPTTIPPFPPTPSGTSPTPAPNGESVPRPPGSGGDGNGVFRPGADDRGPWWIPLLPGLLALAALVAVAMYVWHRQEDRIQDSPAFTKALNIWHPLVRARTNSPRQMKRFINRVRYLAMMPESNGKTQQPSESLIVALAALQGVSRDTAAGNEKQSLPLDLVSLLSTSSSNLDDGAVGIINNWFGQVIEDPELERVRKMIHTAFSDHRKDFLNETATEEILSQFHKMALGIVVR